MKNLLRNASLAAALLTLPGCVAVKSVKAVDLAQQTANIRTVGVSWFKDAQVLGAVLRGSDQISNPAGTNWISTRAVDLTGYTNKVSDQLPAAIGATGDAAGNIIGAAARQAITGN